jgi:hypothetical protein
MSRFYTAPDGTRYPLTEARYDMMFKCYRSDRRKAVPNDPEKCLVALGVKRHKDVLYVYIGSGRNGYIVFKATEDEPAHAVHFAIDTKTRKIIDGFDKDRSAESQTVVLKKPPHSWRLDVRRESDARRRREIRDGSPVNRRGRIARPRIERIGSSHRPLAPISSSGNVNVSSEEVAA